MTTPANPPAQQEGGPQGSPRTPLTDAKCKDAAGTLFFVCGEQFLPVGFSRALERDLNWATTYYGAAIADLQGRLAQSEERVKALEGALRDAIWAADYLSEQQAMPDDGYSARLESARTLLSTSKTN